MRTTFVRSSSIGVLIGSISMGESRSSMAAVGESCMAPVIVPPPARLREMVKCKRSQEPINNHKHCLRQNHTSAKSANTESCLDGLVKSVH